MDEITTGFIVLAVHLVLAFITILIVLTADLVKKEQKKAQIWVCLLIPFIGSLFIASFTIHEKLTEIKDIKASLNNTSITDNHGADLHIGQRQYGNSHSDSSD
ncbi:hypothetical protein CBF23_012270 [Marinomonas agarivorans]|nr:hypothetical protein CBF23_012270 [Marinomonas agarivorans]